MNECTYCNVLFHCRVVFLYTYTHTQPYPEMGDPKTQCTRGTIDSYNQLVLYDDSTSYVMYISIRLCCALVKMNKHACRIYNQLTKRLFVTTNIFNHNPPHNTGLSCISASPYTIRQPVQTRHISHNSKHMFDEFIDDNKSNDSKPVYNNHVPSIKHKPSIRSIYSTSELKQRTGSVVAVFWSLGEISIILLLLTCVGYIGYTFININQIKDSVEQVKINANQKYNELNMNDIINRRSSNTSSTCKSTDNTK